MDDEKSRLIRKVAADPLKADGGPASNESICKNYIIFTIIFALGLMIFLFSGYKSTLADSQLSRLIERPVLDQRSYKFIELNNDIRVLLIQDNTTSTSTLSLELAVGFNAETGEIRGISHMLAHLILMNSRNYPSFYLEYFLKSHGGDAGLVADLERTNLCFSVNSAAFERGIQIFANHIRSPLFLKETFEEVAQLMDSEMTSELEKGRFRTFNLARKLADPGHVISRFFPGNRDSVIEMASKGKIDLNTELDWYFNEYYSGNLMSLVLVGNHSIESMEKAAREGFVGIKNNRMPAKNPGFYPENPFPFNNLGKLLLFESQSEIVELSVIFPMKEIDGEFRTKPMKYLLNLMNWEGEEGFGGLLRKRGMAFESGAGMIFEGSDCALMEWRAKVPKTAEIKEIVKVLFAFIDYIAEFGVAREVYEDMARKADLAFHLEDKTESILLETQRIARKLGKYPLSNVLNGDSLLFEFDEAEIRRSLGFLSVRNAIITLTTKGFDINEDSVRLQQFQQEESKEMIRLDGHSEKNESRMFRFTDLDSLKQELRDLKEKAVLKTKMTNSSKFKVNEVDASNESDFSDYLEVSLDSFDDLTRTYYRVAPLSEKTLSDLSNIDYTYLNDTVKLPPSDPKFYPSRLTVYSKCPSPPKNSSKTLKTSISQTKTVNLWPSLLNLTLETLCIQNATNDIHRLNYSENEGTKVFYKLETSVKTPKIGVFIDFIYNSPIYTTKTNMLFVLTAEILAQFLKRSLPGPLSSGTYLEVKPNLHGLELYIETWNSEPELVLDLAIGGLLESNSSEFLFSRNKQVIIDCFKEEKFAAPILKSLRMFEKIATNYNHIYQEKVYELEGIDFEAFKAFLKTFKEDVRINKLLIYGQTSRDQAEGLKERVFKSFNEGVLNQGSEVFRNLTATAVPSVFKNRTEGINNTGRNDSKNGSFSNASRVILNGTNKTKPRELNNTGNSAANSSKQEDASNSSNISQQRALFYTNVSYIPLTFLNLSGRSIRFSFKDSKGDFEDKVLLLTYFQTGLRSSPSETLKLAMISLYLDQKLEEFLGNNTDFGSKSIRKLVQPHFQKNVEGLLLILEIANKANLSCIGYLMEKFIQIMHFEINGLNSKQLDSLRNRTAYSIANIYREGGLRERGQKIWLDLLNGIEHDVSAEMGGMIGNISKGDLHDFYYWNLINQTNRLQIKIEREDGKEEKGPVLESDPEFYCGINPKLLGMSSAEVGSPCTQSKDYRSRLKEEIDGYEARNSNKEDFRNINELKDIPSYVFYF